MRVWKLGGQVKFELLPIRNILVSQSQHVLSALLLELFTQHWLQRRIKLFLNVLHQHDLPITDCVFEYFQEIGFAELGDMDFLVFAHIFNPFVGLALGVDDQGPPSTIEDEYAVVSGKGISW